MSGWYKIHHEYCEECGRPLTAEEREGGTHICMECVDLLYRANHESFAGRLLEFHVAMRQFFDTVAEEWRATVARVREVVGRGR